MVVQLVVASLLTLSSTVFLRLAKIFTDLADVGSCGSGSSALVVEDLTMSLGQWACLHSCRVDLVGKRCLEFV